MTAREELYEKVVGIRCSRTRVDRPGIATLEEIHPCDLHLPLCVSGKRTGLQLRLLCSAAIAEHCKTLAMLLDMGGTWGRVVLWVTYQSTNRQLLMIITQAMQVQACTLAFMHAGEASASPM
jgi:hypothetical protein